VLKTITLNGLQFGLRNCALVSKHFLGLLT